MKYRDLIKQLAKFGYVLARNGASHDIFTNGEKEIIVPRHREIKEITAKEILKKAGS